MSLDTAMQSAAAEARSDPNRGVLAALNHGDRSAFRGLYDRTERKLHRLAWAILLDHAEASDVVQDAFLRMHQHAARLPSDTNLEAWLCRVTINAASSWRRRWLRFGRAWEAPLRRRDDPEGQVGASQGLEVLAAGLKTLPSGQRVVVALHLDQGLEPSQIAELLEITPNSARVRLHRALRTLRQTLREAGIDPESLHAPAPAGVHEEPES